MAQRKWTNVVLNAWTQNRVFLTHLGGQIMLDCWALSLSPPNLVRYSGYFSTLLSVAFSTFFIRSNNVTTVRGNFVYFELYN